MNLLLGELVQQHIKNLPLPPRLQARYEAKMVKVRQIEVLLSKTNLTSAAVERKTGIKECSAVKYLNHLVEEGKAITWKIKRTRWWGRK